MPDNRPHQGFFFRSAPALHVPLGADGFLDPLETLVAAALRR
jgi:hypothetical protein